MLIRLILITLLVAHGFCRAEGELESGRCEDGSYICDFGEGSSIKLNFGASKVEPEVGTRLSNNPDIRGSEDAIQKAINFYQQHKNGINCNGYQKGKTFDKPYIVVNDFTRPQSEKRQFLINLETGDVTATYTAHGYGSNIGSCPQEHQINCGAKGIKCAIPLTFGNSEACGEGTTLSGFFRVGEGYRSNEQSFNKGPPDLDGKEHNALRLHGLEQGKNHTAMDCGKVWHASQYTAGLENKNACSNSAGCPTVPPDIFRKFRDAIKDGALMYNHTIIEEKVGTPSCQPSEY